MNSATLGVGDDDLVTGEAVALDLPAASIGSLILSGLLDYVLVWLLMITLLTAGSALAAQLDEALLAATLLVSFVLAWVVYPTTVETLSRGRSVGKLATGLRTVRDDGGPITFRHALTRALIGVVEIYLLWGIPAVISSVLSSKGKRLGDLAAGTYVVRIDIPVVLPPPVPMPMQLAGWATAADIAGLPDDLALSVRSFLPAAHTMTPEARDGLGRQLVAEVMQYVAPAPPAGNHQEYVLAAVLAERRRRDSARLAREASLRWRLTTHR